MIAVDPGDRSDILKAQSHAYFWTPAQGLEQIRRAFGVRSSKPPPPRDADRRRYPWSAAWQDAVHGELLTSHTAHYRQGSITDLMRLVDNTAKHLHEKEDYVVGLVVGLADHRAVSEWKASNPPHSEGLCTAVVAYFTRRFPSLLLVAAST